MLSVGVEEVAGRRARVAHRFGDEIRFTARMGAPLALGELGWMSTYLVDALMVGRLPHSALSIAASSLGNTIFYAIAFCAVRLFTGMDTLVAQEFGRDEGARDEVRSLAQSLWIVVVATPLVMVASLGAVHLLPMLGTPPEIVAETTVYLRPLVWSTGPLLLYWALRGYLQSVDRVLLVTFSLLTAALVNWGADWALLFGHAGFRPMGVAGSAWSTVVVRLYTACLLMAGVAWTLRGRWPGWALLRVNMGRMRSVLRIGWPASLQNVTDLGYSTFMSIVCARLGATMLAAHQVTLDLDAFVYMVPAGLSYATLVRVGQAAGRNSAVQVKRAANASFVLGMSYSVVAAVCFGVFRHFWAGLYTTDALVVAAAAPVFVICAVLQLGDAAGALLGAALTGLGDTRTPFLTNTVVYWMVGAPVSWWMAFDTTWGLRGLWMGRAVAALGTAAVLGVVWRRKAMKVAPLVDGGGLVVVPVADAGA